MFSCVETWRAHDCISSTRTVCALGMAAQKGGFHIRDMLHWCYFSGFPKSHDISKAIDKDAGAVREVIGKSARHGGGLNTGKSWNIDPKIPDITKPATQDAQKWAGFGTALKPAVEPALLLRKPLEGWLDDCTKCVEAWNGCAQYR